MLKKTIIAAALAGAAMLAMAGSANAAGAKTLSSPVAKHTSHAAPKAFKITGKRRFRHGRRFRHWNNWHYRPYRSCHRFKRKARWTGKHYWWKRYYACRSHSYYAN